MQVVTDHLDLEEKTIIVYKFLKIYDFFYFLKKFVTILNFFMPNIITCWTKFDNKLDNGLRLQFHLIFNVNFDKFTIGLHFFFLYPSYLQNINKINN